MHTAIAIWYNNNIGGDKKMNVKRTKNKKGFTLVEMLIVLGVMAILIAMIAPNFSKVTSTANKQTYCNDVATLSSALTTYLSTNGYTTLTDAILTQGMEALLSNNSSYLKSSQIKNRYDASVPVWSGVIKNLKSKPATTYAPTLKPGQVGIVTWLDEDGFRTNWEFLTNPSCTSTTTGTATP